MRKNNKITQGFSVKVEKTCSPIVMQVNHRLGPCPAAPGHGEVK